MKKLLSSFFAFLASFLIFQDDFNQADLAVVLSGAFPRGILEASDLYREKRISKILLIQERPRRGLGEVLDDISVEETTKIQERYLLAKGVSRMDIFVTSGAADSTKAEARDVETFLLNNPGFKSIVVIPRKFQSHRAAKIFKSKKFEGYEMRIKYSRYDDVDPRTYWRDPWGLYEFAMESMKWVYDGIAFLLPFLHYDVEEIK